jgi:Protein kinase domain
LGFDIGIEQKTKRNKKANDPNIFGSDAKSSQFMNLSQFEDSHYEGNEEDREDVMLARSELHNAVNLPLYESRSTTSTTAGGKISKDDFHIIKVVGRGGFGKVYMVKKRTSGKTYAMKVLSKDQIASRNLSVKTKGNTYLLFIILVERDIMEKISSPFIVDLYYAFQTDEKLYFIMDFLNGGELFYHLRREQRFTENRAKFYAA